MAVIVDLVSHLVTFKVQKRRGREGGSDARLWTLPKILVMFIVKFVRYDFRVCRVAMFFICWYTNSISCITFEMFMICLHSNPHVSQSVSKCCTVLKIYCHTSFQNIQLSVSSFSHSISSHVDVVAGDRKLKVLGVTSTGIIFILPFKKISQLVQKLECCEGVGWGCLTLSFS